MTRPAVTQGASNAEGAASHGRNKYEDIATKAVGMTESIKHAIVLLQIAKVSFEVNKKGSFEKVRTDVYVLIGFRMQLYLLRIQQFPSRPLPLEPQPGQTLARL